jgi:hypothetical protein
MTHAARPAIAPDAEPTAVQADDALLDALGGPNPSLEPFEARFAQALQAWRREVESEPVVRLVDTDTALALIRRRSEPRGLRKLARWLRRALRGMR